MLGVHRGAFARALMIVSCSTGCYGVVEGERPEASATHEVQVDRFARLSHEQWQLTVSDLLGLDAQSVAKSLASDPLGGRAFDNDAAVLTVDPALFADYQVAAELLAEQATVDPALLARLVPPSLPTEKSAKARAFIETFGLSALRRPLRHAEIEARLELFERGAALYPELDPFVAGLRVSVAGFLQSPHFIYRIEGGDAAPSREPKPLDGWQRASRLSYALWNSMPDQELFRAAGAGELESSAGVHTQVERMLQSPRARATIGRFFDQLYQANQYERLSKNLAQYPAFTPELGRQMRTELGKFAQNIYDEGGGLRQLLTSTTTFVTPALAGIYGLDAASLPAADADGFARVQLDPTQRAGLLTLSGFLAWQATESQPKTIGRGVFVLRKIICQPLGNPPPTARGVQLGGQATDRERIEALTGAGTCGAACHGSHINPAGFAFEHFGALGEYRTSDAGSAIDAAGSLPLASGEVSYDDAIGLSRALAESPQAHACFAGFLLEYLVGRKLGDTDAELAARLAASSLAGASTRKLVATALENVAVPQLPVVP